MDKNDVKVTFGGNPVTLVGKEIKVGEKAPDFTVINNDLKPVKLSDYKGKTRIIQFFPQLTHRFAPRKTEFSTKKLLSWMIRSFYQYRTIYHLLRSVFVAQKASIRW